MFSSVEPEYQDGFSHISEQNLLEIERDFANIKNKLEMLGATVVSPQKARHMVAIHESDPYPDFENVIYQCKHIGYPPSKIPTPIAPDTRRFQFTVCWEIEAKNEDAPLSQSMLNELISELKSRDYGKCESNFFLEPEVLSKPTFIIFELEFLPSNIYQPTSQALKSSKLFFEQIVEQSEHYLVEKVNFVRATKDFWNKEILMHFKSS
jgi:hypothetical protein